MSVTFFSADIRHAEPRIVKIRNPRRCWRCDKPIGPQTRAVVEPCKRRIRHADGECSLFERFREDA